MLQAFIHNQSDYFLFYHGLVFILLMGLVVFLGYLVRVADRLRRAAFHDSLTGLPNRKLFIERLNSAISRAHSGNRFANVFVDLDRFDMINDSLGHHAGDRLLIELGRRLSAWSESAEAIGCAATIDIARLYGDEFGIILSGLSLDSDLMKITQSVQECLAEPFNLSGFTVHTRSSAGIVISDSASANAEELIRAADTAMYRAKAAGGNRCELFDEKMRSQAVERLQLEHDLCRAVERGEFFVVYQPIVALESGKIDGFEALVRWRHPDRGIIAPDRFISVAEETGLIVPIGNFVLRESLRELAFLHQSFPGLSMSVNLSKRQIIEESLIPSVESALQESGIARHLLKLEVTESIVMEHAEAVAPILSRLRDIGVSLSMDDFGTGHSSLSCLHRFPVNCLKIDRAFIHTMGLNRQYAAIVHAVVTLAHNLGMTVVAEGIEYPEQVAGLQSLECELGQGYYFSKPILSNELPAILSRVSWQKKSA